MPFTSGLGIILKRTGVDFAQLQEMLEARQRLIAPHLDHFNLSTLGEVECLLTETFDHRINMDSPVLHSSDGDTLDLQGLFHWQMESKKYPEREVSPSLFFPFTDRYPDGETYVWGLARKNYWVLARVIFVGEPGYKGRRYERATEVYIDRCDPIDIYSKAKVPLDDAWKALGKDILRWTSHRRSLYLGAEKIAEEVRREYVVFSYIEQIRAADPH